jgi:hypothetical protein
MQEEVGKVRIVGVLVSLVSPSPRFSLISPFARSIVTVVACVAADPWWGVRFMTQAGAVSWRGILTSQETSGYSSCENQWLQS